MTGTRGYRYSDDLGLFSMKTILRFALGSILLSVFLLDVLRTGSDALPGTCYIMCLP